MSGGESVKKAASIKSTILGGRLLNLLPGTILAAAYFLISISTGGGAYNLTIAGVLIVVSLCIQLVHEKMLKRIAQYMFITGIVMGVAGVSPPLYFAIVHGVVSLIELVSSIVCIILTLLTIARIKNLNIL